MSNLDDIKETGFIHTCTDRFGQTAQSLIRLQPDLGFHCVDPYQAALRRV